MTAYLLIAIAALMVVVLIHDLVQRKHAILRNFPVIGHFRYVFEAIGPELRQYIVTSNTEERPFSREQRRWVYASSKRENNYFGFGSDREVELSPNYLIIKHSPFPLDGPSDPQHRLPSAKVMGRYRERPKAFRPKSVVNVSGMSFGSLSASAVEALNRGSKLAGCLQSTGEGGISPYHRMGGDLVWQIGTGYFGCRDENGRFSMTRFLETIAANPVRAIEIKLSQGAKPGLGGVLPAAKVTPEIAAIRGVPVGKDCVSPSSHSAFRNVDNMLDFVFIGSGKLGFPDAALFAFALGCDMVNVGREALMAIGCVQAQKCHTGHCPAGVATQKKWLMHGLDPQLKSARLANYVITLRKELLQLSRACGVCHPALISGDRLEILNGQFGAKTVRETFQYDESWAVPSDGDAQELERIMSV